MAGLPLKQGIALIGRDVHPPLIVILLHPFEAMHAPDLVVRLLMVGFGIASVALVYGIVTLWAGRASALLAMGLVSVMPTIVFYDTWIRMYAPLSTVELFGWYMLSLVVAREGLSAAARRAAWVGWVLATTAAAYLQYLAWFGLAAQLIWVACRYRASWVKTGAGAAIALLAWLPQLPVFLRQASFGGRSFPWGLAHPGVAILRIPGEALLHPETAGFFDVAHVVALVGVISALGAVVFFCRGTALPWLGLPALLVIVVSVTRHYSLYLDRYYLLLAYAACAWGAVGLTRLARSRPLKIATVGLIGIIAAHGAVREVDPYYYTADLPAIWSYVTFRGAADGDHRTVVVAEQSTSLLVLDRLYGNAWPREHIPQIGVDAGGAEAAVKAHAIRKYGRVFLVLFETSAVDPHLDLLRDLGKEYRVRSVQRFERASTAESATVVIMDRR